MLRCGANPQSLASSANRQDCRHRSAKINARPNISPAASRQYRSCTRADRVAVRNHPPRIALRPRSRCATSANALPGSQPKRFYEGKGASEQKQFLDRKSTRLNSSHEWISYAVFCLKKKKKKTAKRTTTKKPK